MSTCDQPLFTVSHALLSRHESQTRPCRLEYDPGVPAWNRMSLQGRILRSMLAATSPRTLVLHIVLEASMVNREVHSSLIETLLKGPPTGLSILKGAGLEKATLRPPGELCTLATSCECQNWPPTSCWTPSRYPSSARAGGPHLLLSYNPLRPCQHLKLSQELAFRH